MHIPFFLGLLSCEHRRSAAKLQNLLLLVPQMIRPFSALLKPLTFKTARSTCLHVHVFFFFGFTSFIFTVFFLFVFIGCQCLGEERKQRYGAAVHTAVLDLCHNEAFSLFKTQNFNILE